MRMSDGQKRVASNIFRDLTKLTIVALVVGQFVPGQSLNLSNLVGGVLASMGLMVVAIIFAVDEKEAELQ